MNTGATDREPAPRAALTEARAEPVVIESRVHPDGTLLVRIDGLQISAPDPLEAAMAIAQERAAASPHGQVLVQRHSPQGVEQLVVGADGRTRAAVEPTRPETTPPETTPPEATPLDLPLYPAPAVMPPAVQPSTASGPASAAAAPPARASTPAEPPGARREVPSAQPPTRRARVHSQRRQPRYAVPVPPWPGLPVLAAVLLVVVLIAAGLVGLHTARTGGVRQVEIVRGQQVSAPVPLEWSATSMWRTPALLSEAGRVLVIDAVEVAVVSSDRQVVLIEAASGRIRWSAPYPQGRPGSALAASVIDGQRVIAAQVEDRLAWWDLASGQAGGLDLPAGAAASFAGTAPLITVSDGRRAWLVADGALAAVDVPEGAKALAGRSDGVVTAAGGAGWWHLRPGQAAGEPGPWEMPGQHRTPQVIAYLGGNVICLLPEEDPQLRSVLVSMDRAEDVRFFWTAAGRIGAGDTTWLPSPSREWGILGRTLIDNGRATTTDLGAWTTQAVASDRAEGQVAGLRAITIVRRPLPLGQLADGEGFPEDLTASGALVRSEQDGGSYLFHLPPKDTPTAATQ